MRSFIVAVIITGFVSSIILFYSPTEGAIDGAEIQQRQKTNDEYIELMKKRNDALRKLLELEELKIKLQTGKAWIA